MNPKKILCFTLVVPGLSLVSFAIAEPVFAQVWIQEIQQAELPTALLPSSRSKIVLKNNSTLGSGTNATLVGGQTLAGQYLITSDSNYPITINLTSLNDVKRVKLKKFKAKYNGTIYRSFPASGLPNPGLSGKIISVGFTTILKPGSPEGQSQPSFTIDVTEDIP